MQLICKAHCQPANAHISHTDGNIVLASRLRQQVLSSGVFSHTALATEADTTIPAIEAAVAIDTVAASEPSTSACCAIMSARSAPTVTPSILHHSISTLCTLDLVTASAREQVPEGHNIIKFTPSSHGAATSICNIDLRVQAATQNVEAGMRALRQAPAQLTVSQKATSRARLVLGLVQTLPPTLKHRLISDVEQKVARQEASIPEKEAGAGSNQTSGSWNQAIRWLAKEKKFQATEMRNQQQLMFVQPQVGAEQQKHDPEQPSCQIPIHGDGVPDPTPGMSSPHIKANSSRHATANPVPSPTFAGDPQLASSTCRLSCELQDKTSQPELQLLLPSAHMTFLAAGQTGLIPPVAFMSALVHSDVAAAAPSASLPASSLRGAELTQSGDLPCSEAVAMLLQKECPRATLLVRQQRMRQHVLGIHQETRMQSR